jgi:electron transfer flavoprotein beta subunit
VNITVCLKPTIDPTQLKPSRETLEPLIDQAPRKNGDFDLNALEEAVRLKERHAGKITVVSVTSTETDTLLFREALAVGADELYYAVDPYFKNPDGLATVQVLDAMIRKVGKPDLILCGEASTDDSSYQVGPMLAEALQLPIITHVSKLELKDGAAIAEKLLEGNVQVISCPLPAVVTVGLEINTPRLPSLIMIRAASRKPMTRLAIPDLGITTIQHGVDTLKVKAMKVERKKQILEGPPDELVDKLVQTLLQERVLRV